MDGKPKADRFIGINAWDFAVRSVDRSGRFRRVSPVALRLDEGRLTERIAGPQPRPQERVLMPEAVRKLRRSSCA